MAAYQKAIDGIPWLLDYMATRTAWRFQPSMRQARVITALLSLPPVLAITL